MMESERIAIAARLHVALRRKTGRVTDTDWMATDARYATEVVRFAREQARLRDDAELADVAQLLETAMAGLVAHEQVRAVTEARVADGTATHAQRRLASYWARLR